MEQNTDWIQKISMHDYVKVNDDVFFFALNFNGLYRMHLPERTLTLLACVPGESLYQKHIYGAITQNAEKLYMPPMNGNEIALFDLKENVFEKISLKYDAKGLPFKFAGAVSNGAKVFLIPARYRYMIAIDAGTQELEYIDSWIAEMNIPDTYGGLFVRHGYMIKGEYLYMASMADNILVKMSTCTMKAELIRVGEIRDGFVDMCFDEDGENIWFAYEHRPIILKWHEKKGSYITYDSMPMGFEYGEFPFINVIDTGSKVTAIGYQANMSVEIRKADNSVQQAKWDIAGTEGSFNTWKARHYFARKVTNSSFLVNNIDDNSFDIIECGKKKESFTIIDECSGVTLAYRNGQILRESKDIGLQQFLDFIGKRT